MPVNKSVFLRHFILHNTVETQFFCYACQSCNCAATEQSSTVTQPSSEEFRSNRSLSAVLPRDDNFHFRKVSTPAHLPKKRGFIFPGPES